MLKLVLLGIITGLIMGLLGIGGGVILIPGLVYLAGYPSQKAVGTSIAVLLLPIGIAAALEYYRQGNVDLRAALIIAVSVMVTAWISAHWAKYIPDAWIKLFFGVFLVLVGIYMAFINARKILS